MTTPPSSRLFSPLVLRGTTFANRAWVSPMCEYSAVEGLPQDWHLVHLGSLARGGAGLVLTEATAVTADGRISPADTGIWNDDQASAWQRITRFIRSQDTVPGIQLAHAGRKASTAPPWTGGGYVAPSDGGWEPTVASSAEPFADLPAPTALSREGIADVVAAFQDAARRALAAGFEVAEIHAAHGYLLHTFLSPLANTRDDDYGGSVDNRIRLLVEVVDAVREVWPDRAPLLVRLSATDWVEGGWDDDDSVGLAKHLGEHGVDLIDCTTGGVAPGAAIPTGPGYQVPFASRVRHESGIPSGAVGMITDPTQAERIVADGDADVVLLARALLREPHWPLRAAHELGAEVRWPPQYERACWST
ncbi:MAG: NADH:flavin oxidoreductase/NADH oxidase [Nocardioidaceae bacterium]|nr:NADH:flavin oxidoreductase/NADH oxidase [Nocardioidaceae bacterium]